MPFIADRTFPMPATTTNGGGPTRASEFPPRGADGRLPGTGPRSPTGASKPPPPPRTVSVKSPSEVPRSPPPSDPVRSYSSSSESSMSERLSTTTRSYSDQFQTSKNHREPEDPARSRTMPVQTTYSAPRQVIGDYQHSQHFEHRATDPSRRGAENQSSSDDVGQSMAAAVGAEPAAVDMLFSYHQMTRDAGDGQFSSSSFSSRCSPAVQTQPVSSAPSRTTIQTTHYYV